MAIMAWISLAAALCVIWAAEGTDHFLSEFLSWTNLQCFLLIESWWLPQHGDWCPNITLWTICSFLPGWLLYPVTQLMIT